MCLVYDDPRIVSQALTPNKECLDNANLSIPSSKKRKARRKVTFAPADENTSPIHPHQDHHGEGDAKVRTDLIATIPPSSTMTQEELSAVHWQAADYAFFRGSARVIAEEVKSLPSSSSRSYPSVLSRTLEICHLVAQDRTDASRTNAARDGRMVLPPRLFGALTDWTREGHSRRGIERYCVAAHGEARPLARQQAIEAVLVTQALLKHKKETRGEGDQEQEEGGTGGFRVGNVELPSHLSHEEIVRCVSLEFTRSAKLYALAMGHADAAAVGNLKTHDNNTL